ncbi:hypothetical protein BC835DRAFT_1310979 [Cytidiella melzeri]|nr:hypothetical protein BC835DRAFT_1310979 [Cytidiella melzeri]
MRFFSSTPKPVVTNMNGLPRATKPIVSSDIRIRRPDRMPKGLNRKDLISLEQARTRPTLIYGGFVDHKSDIVVSNESPLDSLARWATEQGGCDDSGSRTLAISPLRAADFGLAPFTAFMDDEDDFEDDGSFYQGYKSSDDSLDSLPTPTPTLKDHAPVFLPGTVTANLIPLDVARGRSDIRYRPEGFETRKRKCMEAAGGLGSSTSIKPRSQPRPHPKSQRVSSAGWRVNRGSDQLEDVDHRSVLGAPTLFLVWPTGAAS